MQEQEPFSRRPIGSIQQPEEMMAIIGIDLGTSHSARADKLRKLYERLQSLARQKKH
jgi:hypothetical protein